MFQRAFRFIPILTAIVLFLSFSQAAHAAGVVTTCDESHLNAALSGGGLVTFSGDCTITVTSTKTISQNTTIDGSGHKVVLDGGNNVGILSVNYGDTLSVNNLTIQNGNAGDFGGGIYSSGTLIVTNTTFFHNQAHDGGAISCSGFSPSLVVNASTFDTNSATNGGAIAIGCPSSISNSTFYNNSVTAYGGGVFLIGDQASITSSTFLNNAARDQPGGGVYVFSGSTLTLRNTILAGSTNDNCYKDGTITDGGYNLDDLTSCGFNAAGSLSNNRNAKLGSLSDNGGPTNTIPLQSGSAAIGVIPPGANGCATTLISDQRGAARPGSLSGNCSMGAYEYVPAADATITDCTAGNLSNIQAAINTGGRIVFRCSGTITLNQNLTPAKNTAIDASNYHVTLNGGSLPYRTDILDPTANLVLNNITLANSRSVAAAVNNPSQMLIATNITITGSLGPAVNGNGPVFVSNSSFDNSDNVASSNSVTATNSSFKATGLLASVLNVENSVLTSGSYCETQGGTFTDLGYNISDGNSCAAFTQLTSHAHVTTINLGSLADNGGSTSTFALGTGSSALDQIPLGTNGCGLSPDQRGSVRPSGPGCDIGAYEAQEIPVPFDTNPTGLSYSVNSTSYSAAQAPFLVVGGQYPISTTDPQFANSTKYAFQSWSDNGTASHSITVSATNPINYLSTFSISAYLLTTQSNPGSVAGTVNVLTQGNNGYYTPNTAVSLSASANTGYLFSSWTGVTSSNGASASVTMSQPKTVTANFVAAYQLTTNASPNGGGTVNVLTTGTNGYYASGTIVNLSATANPGYTFLNWNGVDSSNGTSASVTMNQARSVTANFAPLYTLATSASPGVAGTVSVLTPPNSGSSYISGTVVGISAQANPGYAFSGWTGSPDIANPVAASTTITMNKNEIIAANFVAANAVTFLPLDASTQGNWPGVYGGDGYIIANNSSNKTPTYATVNVTGANMYTWINPAPSSDQRLPYTGPSSGNRIGSTFYSGGNFSIDLTLTGGQHQVALYLLDLDTTTRSDTITIRNADTQAVLDTRTLSNFHNGVWAVWTMSGHVNIQVANNGGLNAVIAGLFFSTLSSTPAGPAVTIYSPTASQTVTGTITLSANVTAAAGVQSVQFVLDPSNNGGTVLSPLIPGPGATFTYQWNSALVQNGQHTLQVIGKDNLSQTAQSSVTFNVSNGGAPSASAQFMAPADTTTKGNWVGKYGIDGFWIANDPSSAPPVYTNINFTGASNWTWNGSTSEARALLTSPSGSLNSRIASTYYSNTSFTIDLNLNDNQPHLVALYLLDYDDGRSENITIVDANNTSTVLNSQAASNFQNGEYLVWKIQGHVQIQVKATGGLNGVVSGIFFAPASSGGQQQPPVVTVTAPTPNQQASGVFKLQATATSTGSIASVQFYVDNNPVGAAITQGVNSTYSYNLDTTLLSNSTHSVKAVATDNLNQQTPATAVSFSVSNVSAGGSNAATFVKTDTTTQGNWKGVYGGAGEIIANDSSTLPGYAVVNLTGANLFTWTFTTDPRALLTAASTSNRIASVFYNAPGFSIDVNFTDGNSHQLALYLLDWDRSGRAETITIVDASNPSTVLDTRSAAGFVNGTYLVWNITGHVKIQINGTAGPNAVVSGVFFQ